MDDRNDLTQYFSATYFAARARFLLLANDLGWQASSRQICGSGTGPADAPLFIDVAVCEGADSAPWQTVIVSSGLHGVEGFFGSAVQCAAMDRLLRKRTRSTPRLIFVHALNPYGFAYIRRCNEDNVDLNRNFLSEPCAYRGSPPDYARFDSMLNRPSPPSFFEPFRLLALLAILRYGMPALRRAIASGQYEYPQGLFYGGTGPCATTRFVQEQFPRWLGTETGPVLHLDFHTGLGRWGEFQLLADLPPTAAQAERIRRVFGRDVVSSQPSSMVAYAARGSIGEWCLRHAAARDYTYLCAEFGTYSPVKMLAALRAENRLHHWGRPGTCGSSWAKRQLLEAFCPRSRNWRQRAAQQGVELIERALGMVERSANDVPRAQGR
jgi:hypothetical protein